MKKCLWAEESLDGRDRCVLFGRIHNRIIYCGVDDPEHECSRYSEFEYEEEEDA